MVYELFNQVLIGSLSYSRWSTSIVNARDYIKHVWFNNQQCMAQPTVINLDPNQYIEGLRYYLCIKYIFEDHSEIKRVSKTTLAAKIITDQIKQQKSNLTQKYK